VRLVESQAGRVDRQAQAALFFGLSFFPGDGLRRASQGDDNGEKKEKRGNRLLTTRS
jgi:hypothetical protein